MDLNEIKKVALIDADSLVFYCAMSNKVNSVTLEEAITDLDSRIYEMVASSGCSHYILFKSPHKSQTFRSKIATIDNYKGNRKTSDLPPVFYGLSAYINQLPSYTGSNFEADDAVALFQWYFKTKEIPTVVCSPDKDVLHQLSGTHYNYGKGVIVNTTEEEAERFLFQQVLMGDSTDNITGIPKVGPVKSEKLLKDVELERIPSVCLELYTKTFGLIEGIRNFVETFRLVYILKDPNDFYRECQYDCHEDWFSEILSSHLLSLEAW